MFLSSSGNILEARLTRKGREAMAKGEFKITQFAVSDDGVNYNLYDTSLGDNADQEILSLPVLEANTNDNAALMNLLLTMDEGTQIVTFITVGSTTLSINSTNQLTSLYVATNNAENVSETYIPIDINNAQLFNTNIQYSSQAVGTNGRNITFSYKVGASISTDTTFTFKLQGQESGVQSETITMTVGSFTNTGEIR